MGNNDVQGPLLSEDNVHGVHAGAGGQALLNTACTMLKIDQLGKMDNVYVLADVQDWILE